MRAAHRNLRGKDEEARGNSPREMYICIYSELMLQFLRNQHQNQLPHLPQTNVFLQSTPIFKSQDSTHQKVPSIPSNLSLMSLEEISAIEVIERNNFYLSSIHGENRITISSEDSLVFSKDRSKSNNIHL